MTLITYSWRNGGSSVLAAMLLIAQLFPSGAQSLVEIAADDGSVQTRLFRISNTGPPSDGSYDAWNPAVAFNETTDEFLIVWQANDRDMTQIYGQRIAALTGAHVGIDNFQISNMRRGAKDPRVSYDPVGNEYLVVWVGDHYPDYTATQIYGQRLTATGGAIGESFLIAGGATVPEILYWRYCRYVIEPRHYTFALYAVTPNPTSGEHLVTYHADRPWAVPDSTCPIATIGSEVANRVLNGVSAGGFTFHQGDYSAFGGIAHNAAANQYLIVSRAYESWWPTGNWSGRIFDATGDLLRSNFQISEQVSEVTDSGPVNAIFNTRSQEYLVVWSRNADQVIRGQRVSATGEELGATDFQFGHVSGYAPESPRLTFDPQTGEYLAVWLGTDLPTRALFAQRISATGDVIGAEAFHLTTDRTHTGTGQPVDPGPGSPAVALDAGRRRALVVTSINLSPLAIGENEIFGLFYDFPEPFVVGQGQHGGGELQSWEASAERSFAQYGRLELPWPAYNAASGEIHPTVGDVDGDGHQEIVVGLGRGGNGYIGVFDDARHGNAFMRWIQVPWSTYNTVNGATWPAVGDIDGDGVAEIVAGFGQGGGGYFVVMDDARTNFAFKYWRRVGWPWYADTQSGESHPALMNLDTDPMQEIVIGLGAGGQGWLELFDDVTTNMAYLGWTQVNWSVYTHGHGATYPAAGDLDTDGRDELVVGLGPGSQGWIEVFGTSFYGLVHRAWLQVSWPAYALANGETHPAVGDADGDLAAEIVLGLGAFPGAGGYFEVRDDADAEFTSLRWLNVLRAETSISGGATFPAIGRSH